jgi:hypothetical protein
MTRFIARGLPAIALAAALSFGAAGCKKSVETSSTTSLGSTTTETTSTTPGAAASAPAATTSPGAAGAVRLVDVTLGNSLKADKTVQNATDTFSPKDTIFAAVRTEGAGTATIEAKWTYKDNQVVKTDSQTINPTGPAVTEFSIQKPEGWPAGDYRVEVSVSGGPAGVSKAFKVI